MKNSNGYVPQPLDLNNVELPEELRPLVLSIAENVHEVWAKQRMDQGWTYAAARNDAEKTHPDLKPFSELSPEEAAYDVSTAEATIKQVLACGWKLVPPEKMQFARPND